MIAIFVSRDADEYKRYSSLEGEIADSVGFAPVLTDSSVGNGSRDADVDAELDKAYGRPEEAPQESINYKICLKSLNIRRSSPKVCTIVVESNGTLGDAKQAVLDGGFSTAVCERFLEMIWSVLRGAKLGSACLVPDVKDAVRLFVHWKGGDPKAYEESFNSQIDGLAKKFGCRSLKSYAVSSRRSECFKVDGRGPIEPPCGDDEVERLIRRFDQASTRSKDRAQILKAALGNELSPEDELKVKMVLSKHGTSAKKILKDEQVSLCCAKMLREGVLDEL